MRWRCARRAMITRCRRGGLAAMGVVIAPLLCADVQVLSFPLRPRTIVQQTAVPAAGASSCSANRLARGADGAAVSHGVSDMGSWLRPWNGWHTRMTVRMVFDASSTPLSDDPPPTEDLTPTGGGSEVSCMRSEDEDGAPQSCLLAVQELRATGEKLRMQCEEFLGPELARGQVKQHAASVHGNKVVQDKLSMLRDKLRKQDAFIEKLRELHDEDHDGLVKLVKREAQEIDAELLMRLADVAETAPEAQERNRLLALSRRVVRAVGTFVSTSTALKLTYSPKLYWNEHYESCSYDEAKTRFTRWLEEYRQDREAHEEARRAHPDPVKLDADFARAYEDASLPVRTSMLLDGARVTSGAEKVKFKLSYLLDNNSHYRERNLEWVNFTEALVASGSTTLLTLVRERQSHCKEWVAKIVMSEVATGRNMFGFWGEEPAEDHQFRRVRLRLLARMSFLSAERALSTDGAHHFMSLLQTWRNEETGDFGDVFPTDIGIRRALTRPENHDAITHVMYLTVFMNRHYPWPSQHRPRADAAIAKWIQRSSVSTAREALVVALVLPGFLQVLLADRTLWLLLAACGYDVNNAFDERSMFMACAFHAAIGGRDRLCPWNGLIATPWTGRGTWWNGFFTSRQEERRLANMLRKHCATSSFLCSKQGMPVLLDICRQRRRRVVQAVAVGAPSAFAAAAPQLLAFVRGPKVRGKKERLTRWLESTLEEYDEERYSPNEA